MYSTCLHCNANLGKNEVIESFPVGRRLAFDAAKGRLWVVCPACRRWNLTPLEERWEAIEEAERLFRATRLRLSSGEVGLARLTEGLELVRVGAPLRPEIAAWRYGEQFSARRRRQLIAGGAILAAGGVAIAGGLYAGAGIWFLIQGGRTLWRGVENGFGHSTVARLRLEGEALVRIRRIDLVGSSLEQGSDGGIALNLSHAGRTSHLEGERARQAARQIFPGINRRGGTSDDIARAIAHLEHAGDASSLLTRTARRGHKLTLPKTKVQVRESDDPYTASISSGLLAIPMSLGLAIEMALNEEQERQALEGDLAELEATWREAEEIAAIADGLLLPTSVEQAWARLKGGA